MTQHGTIQHGRTDGGRRDDDAAANPPFLPLPVVANLPTSLTHAALFIQYHPKPRLRPPPSVGVKWHARNAAAEADGRGTVGRGEGMDLVAVLLLVLPTSTPSRRGGSEWYSKSRSVSFLPPTANGRSPLLLPSPPPASCPFFPLGSYHLREEEGGEGGGRPPHGELVGRAAQ